MAPSRLFLAAAAVLSLTCSGDSGGLDPNAVAVVAVTPDSSDVDTGDSLQLTAVTRNADGAPLSGKPIAWTSLDGATATVTAGGLVRAVWPGSARIVAASEGRADTARVRVLAKITALALTPTLDTLTSFEDEVQVSVQAYIGTQPYAGGSFTWALSDTAVAWLLPGDTVPYAFVRARANGSTRLRVREARGAVDSALVVVRQRVARIDLIAPTVAYRACPLRAASAIPFDARNNVVTDAVLTWTSSDTAIAVVDSTGLISPRAVGTDTITVAADGVSARVALSVLAAPAFALQAYGAQGLVLATVGRGQYATARGSGSFTVAPARFGVVSSDESILEPEPADTTLDMFSSLSERLRLVGRALGTVTLTPYTCDVAGPPVRFTVTPAHLGFLGTLPSYARTDQGSGFLYVLTRDSTGATHYPAESLTVHLRGTDSLVLRPDVAYRRLAPGQAEFVTGVVWVGPGRARLVAEDSAGAYVPDSSAVVEVAYPPLLLFGDTLHLGMRQRSFPTAVGVDVPVGGSPLRVYLSHTDTTVAFVTPDSTDVPVGGYGAAVDVVGRDTIGTTIVTATAARHTAAQSVVVVGRPRAQVVPLFSVGLPQYPGDLPGQLMISATDSITGYTRFPIEAVTFTVSSSDPAVVSLDSTTLTVPAGQGGLPHLATVTFNGPGTAVITATDPRAAFYAYAPGTSIPITVVPRRLIADSLSLGLGQRWSFGVSVEGAILSDVVAHVAHSNPAVAALSDTVARIFNSSRYGAVLAQGLTSGLDSVVATAPGWLPDTGVIVVGPGGSALVTWPAAVAVGDSVSLYLEVLAPNGAQRHADVSTTFTLTPNASIAFVRDGVPVTALTLAPGEPTSQRFYLKGVAAGTGTVTVTAPNYVPLNRSVDVTP